MNLKVPAPMPRQVLLIKAQGDFKHSGKYALIQGRWHLLHPDKSAPKGAPVAAHKHAAGQFQGVALTDEQIAQLQYPADKAAANKEMAAHNNVHLPKLLEHAANGDATAILGTGFGTNSHSKKKALAANVLLGMMGSPHKVELGQAAGAHPAVSQAPSAPATDIAPAAPDIAPAAPDIAPQAKPKLGPVGQALKEATKELAKDDPAAKFNALHEEMGTPSVSHDGKDWFVFGVGATNDEGKVHAHLASKTEGFQQKNGYVPKQAAVLIDPGLIKDPKKEAATAATEKTGLSMPEFLEGKQATGVKAYYEHQAQKILGMAAAGDAAGLEAMKEVGLKPNGKGKVSNTFSGKTQNSKLLLALHEQALAQSKGNTTADQPAPAVSAEPVPAPAAQAAEASQSEAPGISPNAKIPAKVKSNIDGWAASGDKATLQMVAANNKVTNPHIAAYAEKKLAGLDSQPAVEMSAAEKVKQATQAASASLAQDPEHQEAVAIAAQSAAAANGDAASKLAQIPWDNQLLPDSNTNAKSHNGKVAQIKAMAEAGDLAGLEAFKAGKNTYGVKQMKLAALAIAALKESEPSAQAEKVAPAPSSSPLSSAIGAAGSAAAATQIALDHVAKKNTSPAGVAEAVAALKEHGYDNIADKFLEASAIAEQASKAPPPAKSSLAQEMADSKGPMGKMAVAEKYIAANGKTPESYQAVAAAHAELGDDDAAEHWQQKAAELNGPKEGDTKLGADGMLVFKNGRWHKQEQQKTLAEMKPAIMAWMASDEADEHLHAEGKKFFTQLSEDDKQAITLESLARQKKAAKEQHPIDAVPMPELNFTSTSNNAKVAAALEKLKQQIKDQGPDALKGATKHMKAKGKYIITLPGQFGPMKVYGYEHAPDHVGTKVYNYVEALKAAAGKPSKKATAKKATGPVIGANGIESMDGWKQTGPQGGSNPGGKFKDENGVEWYCKFPADDDVAKSEVLAAQLYAIAGVAGQDAKLITKDGKLGIASKWTTVNKASPADLAKTQGTLSGFATDAWLGNWDVVGLGFDNLQVNEKGQAVRVDAGGSLTYRAQGGKKAFGTTVSELDSLRDAKINPQAAAVFGKMTQADITASVAKVLAIPDSAIINAVELHGPGDAANKKALADVLLARKADLAAKFPKAAKPPKKRLDPSNLPVDPSRLPKAHDFNNWLGAGKPLSSQPHVNAANMAVEQEMLALANTGNLTKLKDFKFHAIDKATGNATGQMIPIAQHPSKHVVQLHSDLVMTLDELANPPEPLKVFQETDVGTIEQLSASLPPKKFGTTVGAVKSNEKFGFWVVLGTAHGAQKFKPSKVMDYGAAAIQAGHEKYKQASKLAKHFINSVQASGSYNDLFRNGVTHDNQGNKLTDVAQAALEHATTMPEGTSLYRWQNMPDEMVKKIMGAPDGTVFQATGPMCTSYSSNATSGFGQHRVTIRYAKGAKAVESFGSGGFKGEKEVTTLPNSRFVVLSKQMVPNEKNPGKQRLELEVLMLPPDLGL